ncbi:hypothetical protein [Tardiphaga sp. OK246]|nr:hypothetical protein [Tardiphaga sp. OK246]
MWTRDGWKRMKKGYAKVGILLTNQSAVRAEELWWERKDAR